MVATEILNLHSLQLALIDKERVDMALGVVKIHGLMSNLETVRSMTMTKNQPSTSLDGTIFELLS